MQRDCIIDGRRYVVTVCPTRTAHGAYRTKRGGSIAGAGAVNLTDASRGFYTRHVARASTQHRAASNTSPRMGDTK